MKHNHRLQQLIHLSLAGALVFGFGALAQAAPAAPAANPAALAQRAEYHNGSTTAQAGQAITILPINRAKLWAGQRFDFEVEFPAGSTGTKVTINGTDAEKVFHKAAVVHNYGTHLSYRINNVSFPAAGAQEIVAAANGGQRTRSSKKPRKRKPKT